MKKYELTQETKEYYGRTLYRIRALKDFGDVKNGDLGGWIESEENLSQEGDCWVFGQAMVYGQALIYGEARVYAQARVCDNARIYDLALVCNEAFVHGQAKVYGEARVYGQAMICDNARIYDEVKVYDQAQVYGQALVYGQARVYGRALVCGLAEVFGEAWVCRDSVISNSSDWLTISPIGNQNDCITFFKTKGSNIFVNIGYFCDSLEKFEVKVKETHGDNAHGEAYRLAIELAKLRILGGNK